MPDPTLPNADELEVVALTERLRTYRPKDEWGTPVHHVICDEAVSCLLALASQKAEYAEALKQAGRTIQHNISRAEAAEAEVKAEVFEDMRNALTAALSQNKGEE